ncbi:unnamed protein product [Fusarium equiseti]|uniref:Enoyl reductase (ER) domain-containing protein n=1 Tax=Fusarium equiseti TaxID=61235 RepID=A0A8J2NP97_FUSEQ|nr:unnamed protein product [Fusarium equiseti]
MITTLTKGTALYADDEGKVIVRHLPFPEPQDGDSLIKVLYSGVNLSYVPSLEFFGLKNYALGSNSAATSSILQVGDIVAVCVFAGNTRDSHHATYQEYITVLPEWISKVPENIPPHAADGLPVVVGTAGDALYNRLGLPLPPTVAKSTFDEGILAPEGTLVIWGGSTGCGMAAIQLARASRMSAIVAIASARNRQFLTSLGATQCFDYHDIDVVRKIKSALQVTHGTIWGFDALGLVANPVSQDILKSVIPPHDKVRLATVLLAPHEGFEIVVGGRFFDLEFDPPDGTKLSVPKNIVAANRHWRVLSWVPENYGDTMCRHLLNCLKELAKMLLYVGARAS